MEGKTRKQRIVDSLLSEAKDMHGLEHPAMRSLMERAYSEGLEGASLRGRGADDEDPEEA